MLNLAAPADWPSRARPPPSNHLTWMLIADKAEELPIPRATVPQRVEALYNKCLAASQSFLTSPKSGSTAK